MYLHISNWSRQPEVDVNPPVYSNLEKNILYTIANCRNYTDTIKTVRKTRKLVRKVYVIHSTTVNLIRQTALLHLRVDANSQERLWSCLRSESFHSAEKGVPPMPNSDASRNLLARLESMPWPFSVSTTEYGSGTLLDSFDHIWSFCKPTTWEWPMGRTARISHLDTLSTTVRQAKAIFLNYGSG